MKKMVSGMLVILLACFMSSVAMAGDKEDARKAANLQMLQEEMEPYNDTVTANRVSAKRIDNLHMLLGELEPYSDKVEKNIAPSRKAVPISQRSYANLCMMCDELE